MRWAESATLEVARINDVVALELIPGQSVTGDPNDLEVIGGPDTDWPAIERACAHLADVSTDSIAVQDPPHRFRRAAQRLDDYRSAVAGIAGHCATAAQAEDAAALKAVGPEFTEAGRLLARVDGEIPDFVGCPEHIRDRPRTCDEA
jgi:hypothetical protein